MLGFTISLCNLLIYKLPATNEQLLYDRLVN